MLEMPTSHVNRNERSLLSDRVFQHLVDQLSSKKLKIGARINPRQLAESLAVSRTTINKALEQLETKGWIKSDVAGHITLARYPNGKKRGPLPEFRFANQTDNTYEALLDQVLRGRWQPGEILKGRPVAQSLGVNPATVRRAADLLSKDGLLVRVPRRGWRVSVIDRHDLHVIYRVRLMLEPLYIHGAVMGITEETLNSLEAEADRLIAAGETATAYMRRQADYNFHRTLAEASGSPILCETLEPLIRKAMLFTAVDFRFGRTKYSFAEHKAVIHALRKRDESAAVKLLKTHLRNAMQANLNVVRG